MLTYLFDIGFLNFQAQLHFFSFSSTKFSFKISSAFLKYSSKGSLGVIFFSCSLVFSFSITFSVSLITCVLGIAAVENLSKGCCCCRCCCCCCCCCKSTLLKLNEGGAVSKISPSFTGDGDGLREILL